MVIRFSRPKPCRPFETACRCCRKGFTLLEILLVIALIGLMSGFLLTDWGNVSEAFGRRDWRETVEEAFRRGHFLAEIREEGVRLRFDPESGDFLLEDSRTGEGIESLEAGQIRDISLVRGRADRIADLGYDGFSVRFAADGSATPVVFEVRTDSDGVILRNHPFSGKLTDGTERVDGVAYSDW